MERSNTALKFVQCVACVLVSPWFTHAAERPRIALNAFGDSYAKGSNISVAGSIQPALNATVEFRFYHVQEDGGLLYQAGGHCLAPTGEIGPIGIGPPPGGWPSGKLRCVAFLNQMKQVRGSFDIEIVDRPGWLETPIYEPKVSDVIVDVDAPPKDGWTITAGERFYVRGTFPVPEGVKFQGPSVRARMFRLDPATDAEVINCNGMAYSLLESPGKCAFEVELDSKPVPGAHFLSVEFGLIVGQKVVPAHFDNLPLTLVPSKSSE